MDFIHIMLYAAFAVFAFLTLCLIIGISAKEKVDESTKTNKIN